MRKLLTKAQASEVLDILDKTYPDAHCELEHESPFELLVATILSAQCTDVRVNAVTKEMYKEYKKPMDFLNLGLEGIEVWVKPCGFYRNKAKNIYMACKKIMDDFGGEVPNTIEDLLTLPGVGKKTANVVASTCFGVPAIAVDTHVFRLSNRIGFVAENNVVDTEKKLQKKIENKRWTKAHHLLIFHGRRVCKARRPLCQECNIRQYCKFYSKESV